MKHDTHMRWYLVVVAEVYDLCMFGLVMYRKVRKLTMVYVGYQDYRKWLRHIRLCILYFCLDFHDRNKEINNYTTPNIIFCKILLYDSLVSEGFFIYL